MATVQSNIINDLSNYTKVPIKVLNKLTEKAELCIGSAIHDALLTADDVAIINIGIGSLSIELKTMQCKFIPSKELKSVIKHSIERKADPIELEIEQAIIAKLLSICDGEE